MISILERTQQEHMQVYRSHPWHGVEIGSDAPRVVTAYIEMTPEDTIKYELDKASGILKVDRPQLFSNVCPAFYGFIPRRFAPSASAACAPNVPDEPASWATAILSTSASSPTNASPPATFSSMRAPLAACECSTAKKPTTKSSPS